MRIKVNVSTDSLSKCGFWYVIDNNDVNTTTILDLQRNLNNILHLSKNAKRLQLSLDNFCLLPDSPITDLIRDGDLITVQHGKKMGSLNRLVPVKTASSTKKEKRDTVTKKRKQRSEDKEQQPKQKRQKKAEKTAKSKKTPKDETTPATAPVSQSKETPKDKITTTSPTGTSKSKKRNRRRTLSRMIKREEGKEQDTSISSTTETHKPEKEHAPLTIHHEQPVEPRHLIKKNKNKSKDFMKQMDKSTRSHVVFEPTGDEPGEEDEDINLLGGAFITDSESQHKGRKTKGKNQQNYMNRQYPVDETDAVFYAVDEVEVEKADAEKDNDTDSSDDSSSSDNSSSDDDSSEDTSSEDDSDTSEDEPLVVEKIDYEACQAITFQDPLGPKIGEHLAIKTLHLSETYTPEISDWKRVKVVELTGQEMVVELVGGRVINKTLRKFDLPPEHELEQADDSIETFNYNDVFDMRRIQS